MVKILKRDGTDAAGVRRNRRARIRARSLLRHSGGGKKWAGKSIAKFRLDACKALNYSSYAIEPEYGNNINYYGGLVVFHHEKNLCFGKNQGFENSSFPILNPVQERELMRVWRFEKETGDASV